MNGRGLDRKRAEGCVVEKREWECIPKSKQLVFNIVKRTNVVKWDEKSSRPELLSWETDPPHRRTIMCLKKPNRPISSRDILFYFEVVWKQLCLK